MDDLLYKSLVQLLSELLKESLEIYCMYFRKTPVEISGSGVNPKKTQLRIFQETSEKKLLKHICKNHNSNSIEESKVIFMEIFFKELQCNLKKSLENSFQKKLRRNYSAIFGGPHAELRGGN